MSIIKSFSVGNGDMFYIEHNSDNFTIIDCYLSKDNKEEITDEILFKLRDKDISRFISTHPVRRSYSRLRIFRREDSDN